MDTRAKIVSLERVRDLLVAGDWVVVAGLFDPLTAIQAKRLSELRGNDSRKLLAIVLNSENNLLSTGARSALIAGLRAVDLVTAAEPDTWQDAVPKRAGIRVVENLADEKARSAEFVEFVLKRQQSAAHKQRGVSSNG